ncbi:MAG: fluoride efflux transporter CrcB [Treponema sp.]|nr:fluoride efflux transporter CrcB [Treponema sp.]
MIYGENAQLSSIYNDFIRTISSVSAKGFFSNSYKATFDKTLEQIQVRADLMDKDKIYQKRFTAKDKMGNVHSVTIYDDEYMKIDNAFYAYKLSMYEVNQINSVYFADCNPDEGYVDDFGYWRSYEWTDYYERIFNTRNKDVKMRMYMTMQVVKKDYMLNCLVVALGGGIGACFRYLTGLIPLKEPFTFPVKTLVINLLGCFVIGLIAALAAKNSSLSPKTVLFIKTGLCGGFTTFSTFALETETLIKTGHMGLALVYVVLSVVAGVGLAFAGQVVVGK